MADLEPLVQKAVQIARLFDKETIGSFNGKLYLNTRFFFVIIDDCLPLEEINSVENADLCIDFLKNELSDLDIFYKYDIGIKPDYKKELSALNPDVFLELKKRETANALKIAISRYERRRQDLASFQNNTNTPQVQMQGDMPFYIQDLIEKGYITKDLRCLKSLNKIAAFIKDNKYNVNVTAKILRQFKKENGDKYKHTAITNAVNYAKD